MEGLDAVEGLGFVRGFRLCIALYMRGFRLCIFLRGFRLCIEGLDAVEALGLMRGFRLCTCTDSQTYVLDREFRLCVRV